MERICFPATSPTIHGRDSFYVLKNTLGTQGLQQPGSLSLCSAINQIRNAIPEKIALQSLDQHIDHIIDLESHLRSLRSTLQRYRNVHNHNVYIRRLPNEILSEIFLYGQELHGLGFEVVVSQVSHHWRCVALSTPALWTMVDFQEGPPFEKSEEWLNRSRRCPLHISIPKLRGARAFDLAVTSIIPHISHTRHLTITIDYSDYTADVTGILSQLFSRCDSPEITSFAFVRPPRKRRSSVIPTRSPSTNPWNFITPVTQILHVDGVCIPWALCSFGKLTSLRLANLQQERSPPLEVLHTILLSAPNLLDLLLWDVDMPLNDARVRSITLPRLQKLGFTLSSPGIRSVLMTVLSPSLKSLRIGGHNAVDLMYGDLLPLLDRFTFHTKLQELRLESCHSKHIDVSYLLPKFVALESLHLQKCSSNISNVAISSLPLRLKQLHFFECLGLSPQLIRTHIHARRGQMKHVSMERCSLENGEDTTVFLHREGLA